MRWHKRDIWKAGIALIGLFFFLVIMVWVPMAASAHEEVPGLAALGLVQATPTVNVTATLTALNEEKLKQEIQQLKNQNGNQNNWVANNSTALIAAAATVIVALFGILQWAITVRQAQDKESRDRDLDRQKEVAAQDKELRAQAEERFKTAVTALGDEKESVQVGGAILLCSFIKPGDEEIYGRYYAQIFDLAVAYLRPSNTSLLSEDSDVTLLSSKGSPIPLPLTPLRQALIIVFREAYHLARQRAVLSLDATGIQLDRADLTVANLTGVRMPYSSLRKADFAFASLQEVYLRGSHLEGAGFVRAKLKNGNLTIAHLEGANFNDADLEGANLGGSYLVGAHFQAAHLKGAQLGNADLTRAHLNEADLSGANLSGANLSGTNLEEARSLESTNLSGVKGLTSKQLMACKFKGAIVEVATMVSAIQSAASPPAPSQDSSAKTLPTQVNTPPVNTDGSSSASESTHT